MNWGEDKIEVQLQCRYCGFTWCDGFYTKDSIEWQQCPKCGDSSLIVRDKNSLVIDTYKGCKPFIRNSVFIGFILISVLNISGCALNQYVYCNRTYRQYETFEDCYYSNFPPEHHDLSHRPQYSR